MTVLPYLLSPAPSNSRASLVDILLQNTFSVRVLETVAEALGHGGLVRFYERLIDSEMLAMESIEPRCVSSHHDIFGKSHISPAIEIEGKLLHISGHARLKTFRIQTYGGKMKRVTIHFLAGT